MTQKKIGFKYILIITVAVLFTWLLHEFAHWVVYRILGFEALMTLNKVSNLSPTKLTVEQSIITSAAGPLITVVQAVIAFSFLQLNRWSSYVYPFLFVAFYMRLVAGLMNFKMLNDEGRISEFLEIGTFTIPVLVSSLLFFMVYYISKKHRLHWKFHLATTLLVIAGSTILIMSDQLLDIRIL